MCSYVIVGGKHCGFAGECPHKLPAFENPFKASVISGTQYFHVDAENRLHALKGFDLAQCEAALQVQGLQKTVERAVCARINALKKGGA